jgi:hypothetical protein
VRWLRYHALRRYRYRHFSYQFPQRASMMNPTIHTTERAMPRFSAGMCLAVGMDVGIAPSMLRAAPLPAAI